MIQLRVHLIRLLSLLPSPNSFRKQGCNVSSCYIWCFCLLIDTTLIPFWGGFGCTRDVKVFFFKFFIVGNELLFSYRGSCFKGAGCLTCCRQLGVLASLHQASSVRIIWVLLLKMFRITCIKMRKCIRRLLQRTLCPKSHRGLVICHSR